MAQAEDFTCSKEERCERASLVGRTVIAHDGRKSLNRRAVRDGAGGIESQAPNLKGFVFLYLKVVEITWEGV